MAYLHVALLSVWSIILSNIYLVPEPLGSKSPQEPLCASDVNPYVSTITPPDPGSDVNTTSPSADGEENIGTCSFACMHPSAGLYSRQRG